MIDILFWISAVLIAYVYVGYPLLVALSAAVLDRRVKKSPATPFVTIVIPAHNEERYIRATVRNKLELDYPKDRMEILVVSDGSTDQTDRMVREFAEPGVRLIRQEPRQGKTSALNRAIGEARGEIIAFSDANSLYQVDALRQLVANFSDDSVGYVTGKMIYVHPDGSVIGDGCSTYMKYENFIRSAETRVGSLVGVNGGIDAVRKYLYEPMLADRQPDFVLPLKVVEKGYRVVYEPNAVVRESALSRAGDEYRMRVRVALRALHAIWDGRRLLNPLRYGLFAWQLLSHKALRYGAFILLIVLYLLNLALVREAFLYRLTLLLQTVFYSSALVGWVLERNGKGSGILYIPFYFSLLNVASIHAFFKMLLGSRPVTWNPRGG